MLWIMNFHYTRDTWQRLEIALSGNSGGRTWFLLELVECLVLGWGVGVGLYCSSWSASLSGAVITPFLRSVQDENQKLDDELDLVHWHKERGRR